MKFTAEEVLRYLENYGKAICLLPLNQHSNKILSILNTIGFYFSITNLLVMILSILMTTYVTFTDHISVMKLLGLTMLHLEVLSNMLIWRIKKSEIQNLLQRVYEYIRCAEASRNRIINVYVDRYKYFYVSQIFFAVISFSIQIILTPLLESKKLPCGVWYPFPIEPFTLTYFVILFLQIIDIIHCPSQIIFPLITIVFFLHISIKLEHLTQDLQTVKNSDQLIKCIKRHQNCINIVDNINCVLQSTLVKTYFILGLTIIFASSSFIHDFNYFVTFRASFTVINCLLCTYIYIEAADDLYSVSQSVAVTLCGLEWNDELMKMKRSLLIMICRAQKPLAISPLNGLMPVLTRKVYASFLSYLISYIMTLRVIVDSHQYVRQLK